MQNETSMAVDTLSEIHSLLEGVWLHLDRKLFSY